MIFGFNLCHQGYGILVTPMYSKSSILTQNSLAYGYNIWRNGRSESDHKLRVRLHILPKAAAVPETKTFSYPQSVLLKI